MIAEFGLKVGELFKGLRRRAWAPELATVKGEAGSIEVDSDNAKGHELPNTLFEWPADVEPNLITSKIIGSNLHAPCIDLDLPVKLIPSQTPGHWHLYVDMNVEWEDYAILLAAMRKCGIIQQGYFEMSIKRGFTALRPPQL
jgi:hypothetical protein